MLFGVGCNFTSKYDGRSVTKNGEVECTVMYNTLVATAGETGNVDNETEKIKEKINIEDRMLFVHKRWVALYDCKVSDKLKVEMYPQKLGEEGMVISDDMHYYYLQQFKNQRNHLQE